MASSTGAPLCRRRRVRARRRPGRAAAAARPPGRRQRRSSSTSSVRGVIAKLVVTAPCRAPAGAVLPSRHAGVRGAGRGAAHRMHHAARAMAVRSPHRAAACRHASRPGRGWADRVRDVVPGRSRRCAGALRNLEHGIRRARPTSASARRLRHASSTTRAGAAHGEAWALSFAGGIGALVGQLQHHLSGAGQCPPALPAAAQAGATASAPLNWPARRPAACASAPPAPSRHAPSRWAARSARRSAWRRSCWPRLRRRRHGPASGSPAWQRSNGCADKPPPRRAWAVALRQARSEPFTVVQLGCDGQADRRTGEQTHRHRRIDEVVEDLAGRSYTAGMVVAVAQLPALR